MTVPPPDFTITPEDIAAKFTAPRIVVTEQFATANPSPFFVLRHLVNGTTQHQSVIDPSYGALLSAAEILEVSMSLGIDEDHERYAGRILHESRRQANTTKL